MIITISGTAGSGKSTVAKLVAQKLGLKFYSMGDLRGKMAMKRGLTIDELNEIGKTEDWTDREADEYQEKLGKTEDNFIVDGWVSFHFIPHSIKIFLDADLKEAAKRIFKDQRPDEPKKETVEEVKEMIEKRIEESRERYKKYYCIDFLDKKHYDFIVDTTEISAEQVADKVVGFVKEKEK